jgi:DNA-binding HxlR family transcriptional regulator
MARTNSYAHYCAIARALEVIGEKWSLLVVRDLLRGAQRFSDLHRYMGGITPKRLTARLRDMEASGLVERETTPGRREVWYRLTATGEELRPVVEALAMWGVDNFMRPPLPHEPVYPEMYLQVTAAFLNRQRVTLERPVAWEFRFADGHRPVRLTYDGERWSTVGDGGAEHDVVVETTAGELLDFLNARNERPALYERFRIDGEAEDIAVFRRTFVRERAHKTSPPLSARPSHKGKG